MSKNLIQLFKLLIIYFKYMHFYLFSHITLSRGARLLSEAKYHKFIDILFTSQQTLQMGTHDGLSHPALLEAHVGL